MASVALPVSADAKAAHKNRHDEPEKTSREPFGDIPKGPVQIFVSIDQQKLHLYSDGVHIADTSVATGVLSLPTPLGVFSVIQKQVFHRSNLYSNAPMPFMQRITWSGVALHEGESIGHRASHGCIRMPGDFATRLYKLTKLGARVIVADGELKPEVFADPHLFVHKAAPPPPAAAADPVKTAETSNNTTSSDAAQAPKSETPAADPDKTAETKPDDLKGTEAQPTVQVGAAKDTPLPQAKPPEAVQSPPERKGPIAVFVSRKEGKIYVRQNFEPLFDALVTIAHPERAIGTHVFTALDYLSDGSTFRWNVVSFPAEPPKPARHAEEEKSDRRGRHKEPEKPAAVVAPPETSAEVLARIDIPQDVIDHISALMVPGSSLVVSDQGLGDETGEGTDFIVVTR